MQPDERWADLHRRVCVGEKLSVADEAEYQAGCRALDADENLDGDLARLQAVRTAVADGEGEQRRLREREAELSARIAAMAADDDREREALEWAERTVGDVANEPR